MEHITAEHESSSATLSKEARRWATKIARENNNIKENVRKLQMYNAMREAGQKVRISPTIGAGVFEDPVEISDQLYLSLD